MSDTASPAAPAAPTAPAVAAVEPSAAMSAGADGAPDTFDAASIIERFSSQLLVAKDAPPAAAPPPPQAPVLPGVGGQPSPVTPPAAEPVETPSAKRLAALARAEADVASQKAAVEQRVADAVTQAKALLVAEFRRNPLKFARDANVPREVLEETGSLLLGAGLGEDAPADIKTKLSQYEMESRLAAIEESQKAREQTAEKDTPAAIAYQIQLDTTDREISRFVQDVPATEFPFLAAEAGENLRETYQALCNLAAPFIKQGHWPSAREAAKLLEAELRSDYERLSRAAQSQSASPRTQPSPSATQEPPKTLSDADVSRRPDRQPEGLLSDAEYQARAIRRAEELGGLLTRR